MVKKSSDEPDDKALERLREFEQKRAPVPEKGTENDKKAKDKKGKDKEKEKGNDAGRKPHSATDK